LVRGGGWNRLHFDCVKKTEKVVTGKHMKGTKQAVWRYTISETARQEILEWLLAPNHKIYAKEMAAGLHEKRKGKKAAKADVDEGRGAGGEEQGWEAEGH